MEVEAAKGVLYRRPILRAAQLLQEVYSTVAVEEKDYDVMYPIDGIH